MLVALEVQEVTAMHQADLRDRRVAEELEVQDVLELETPEETEVQTQEAAEELLHILLETQTTNLQDQVELEDQV